jgi:hypothetical protein
MPHHIAGAALLGGEAESAVPLGQGTNFLPLALVFHAAVGSSQLEWLIDDEKSTICEQDRAAVEVCKNNGRV